MGWRLLPAASLVASAGILFPAVWWLGVVGLSLFCALLRADKASLWPTIGFGLVFGFLTGGAGVAWLWQVLPLDFLQIPKPSVQVAAVGMTWTCVSVSLGLPVGIFAVLLRCFRDSVFFPFACAVLWPLAEIGRMWSFALLTWAPQSLLGPHFSPAALGYTLAENHLLLQLAHPLGLDALNFCAALAAGLGAVIPDAVRDARIRPFLVAQVCCLFALLLLAGFASRSPARQPSKKLRVAIVCENLQEVRDFSTHHATSGLVARAAASDPPVDVVVLPEEIGLTSMFRSKPEAGDFMRTHFGLRDVLIVNTRNELFPAEEKNLFPESKKLLYDSKTRGEIGRYVKQMLMPLGEYAPVAAKAFFSLLRDEDLKLYLEEVAAFPVERQPLGTVEFRGWRIGALLCSDLMSPELYRELAVIGPADVLVNLANPFWFHGSHLLQWKTVQIAKVHAVQNRLPLLVANNLAPSFVVSASGRIVAESSWNRRDVLYVSLPLGDK